MAIILKSRVKGGTLSLLNNINIMKIDPRSVCWVYADESLNYIESLMNEQFVNKK